MKHLALFKFRLYVASDALCQAHLASRHEIEVVNVFKNPQRAIADGIFLTPTLILLVPSPMRRIVGTLSQTQSVLQALGLESFTP